MFFGWGNDLGKAKSNRLFANDYKLIELTYWTIG